MLTFSQSEQKVISDQWKVSENRGTLQAEPKRAQQAKARLRSTGRSVPHSLVNANTLTRIGCFIPREREHGWRGELIFQGAEGE